MQQYWLLIIFRRKAKESSSIDCLSISNINQLTGIDFDRLRTPGYRVYTHTRELQETKSLNLFSPTFQRGMIHSAPKCLELPGVQRTRCCRHDSTLITRTSLLPAALALRQITSCEVFFQDGELWRSIEVPKCVCSPFLYSLPRASISI